MNQVDYGQRTLWNQRDLLELAGTMLVAAIKAMQKDQCGSKSSNAVSIILSKRRTCRTIFLSPNAFAERRAYDEKFLTPMGKKRRRSFFV